MRLGTEHDVFQGRQSVHEHEVLVDHADSLRNGVIRIANDHALSLHLNHAAIGLIKAVQNGHQGALARAVLAHDPVHRTGGHTQIHICIGCNCAETLVDTLHMYRRWRRCRWRCALYTQILLLKRLLH